MPLHPTVLWAQRQDLIYLTVQLMDITKPEIQVKPESFHFKGQGEKEQQEYGADIEFYAPVDVERSKQHLTPRNLTMIIYKQKEEYWPRLQKGGKLNFLKVDFARWRDEDDSEEEEGQDPMGGMDFSSLMSQAGNMGLPNMDDLPAGDDSSSDEEEEEKNNAPQETKQN